MSDNPRLLVVDDEAVICQACRRVFSHQGFQVEECTDARQGLNRATEGNYAAVLLDIKMPEMDGIEFLEELRKRKPNLPVMIMTGYPSIPNAASAVRLGASDYVTKPFTPEQITQSVRRMLARDTRDTNGRDQSEAVSAAAGPYVPRAGEFLFLDESWVQPEEDGSACVGAVLPRRRGATAQAVRLPEVGEAVYQGLPLAGVTSADGSQAIVPSPISGVVVSINELLAEDASTLLKSPCGEGWIACICTTRLEEEIDRCKPRRLILVNGDEGSAGVQCAQLTSLGCQVEVVSEGGALAPAVQDPNVDVVVFDAAFLGETGPELARQVNLVAPSTKVVVIGPATSEWETAYREQKIFYYAVEPFADNEIVEILNAVFRRPAAPVRQPERRKPASEPISGIGITNRNGHKVQLLCAPGLLRAREGLGGQIRQRLIDQVFPIRLTPGEIDVTPTNVLKAAGTCDRVMVLLAKDTGRLPGSLVRDTKAEYVLGSRENASRVTTLVVQPGPNGDGFTGLDERTIAVLAEHIVQEMASY